MKNEIPVAQKETERDDSSFDEETNTRVLEMSLVAYVKSGGDGSLVNDKIQSPYSTIFKENDVLKDEYLYYKKIQLC